MNSAFIVSIRKASNIRSFPLNDKKIDKMYKKKSKLMKKIEKTILNNRTTGKQLLVSTYNELREVQKNAETFVMIYCSKLRNNRNIDKQPFKSHYWNTLELLNIIEDAEHGFKQLAKTYFPINKKDLTNDKSPSTPNKKTRIEQNTNDIRTEQTYTFDSVFISPSYKKEALQAAKKVGLINDSCEWIYGGKKGAIIALIEALKTMKKIHNIPTQEIAQLFAKKFNTTITERTTRNRPKYYNSLLTEIKASLI